MSEHHRPTPDTLPQAAPAPEAPSNATVAARAFVGKIMQRCAEDRGARAALRSGLGKPPDRVPRMHRIVGPLLPDWVIQQEDVQRHYYAVASMIALLPSDQLATARKRCDDQGLYGTSLGATLAKAVAQGTRKGIRQSAAEARITLLTKQSVEGLHRHLPSTVRQLQNAEVDIDYARLLTELRQWQRHRGGVTRRWLQDFYRARFADERQAAQQADDHTSPTPVPGT
ncbi:type I-E CRISPR-associated protein Cse2/CasB [Nocardiopsis sp. SBT366]|uniref:type I-E CRISPR-associated protein Cse2/CasB n=1 Tax=Nocardiopsis sp. SBT366 TaxID=1580529 RepID=UPI00066A8195|nr:type I-E CRISPR-associated protein Cse2/CasB [Nocardiopsis sp. SBT366]